MPVTPVQPGPGLWTLVAAQLLGGKATHNGPWPVQPLSLLSSDSAVTTITALASIPTLSLSLVISHHLVTITVSSDSH